MSASLQLLQTTQQGKHDFRQNFPQNLVVLEVFCHFGYFLAIFDCHSRPKWGHQARKAWCQPVSSYCRQLNEVNIWFPRLFFHKIWYFWGVFLPFWLFFGIFWQSLTIVAIQNEIIRHVKLDVSQSPVIADNSTR